MTAHAKVTTIAHTAAGLGQVWYRVTGSTGAGNVHVAYRAGVGMEDCRRVRFVGAGATAELARHRGGHVVVRVGGQAQLRGTEGVTRLSKWRHITDEQEQNAKGLRR